MLRFYRQECGPQLRAQFASRATSESTNLALRSFELILSLQKVRCEPKKIIYPALHTHYRLTLTL